MKKNPGRKERRRYKHQERITDGKRKMKLNASAQKREAKRKAKGKVKEGKYELI